MNGYATEGAGENLVCPAGDFENFMARPELPERVGRELTAVTRMLAERRWPIRVHATYDESIGRLLDVFELVFEETGYGARWRIDHAETISPANLRRVKAMSGGIAVQNRVAFAGEFFVEWYGAAAAAEAPPLRRMLDAGLPVGGATDATRLSSYNPWVALQWMVTDTFVGVLFRPRRTDSNDRVGADDGGRGRRPHAAEPFPRLVPGPPPVTPPWSPVAVFGGYQKGQ